MSTDWIHFPARLRYGFAMARKVTNGGTAMRRTRPGDTAGEAYLRLRDLIVDGAFEPGQRLPHARLMRLLDVGRTPLRTALSRLESDGLVVGTPNHGVAVAPLPVSSAEEIYTMRFLVEPPLLEATADRIDEERLCRLRACLEEMEATLADPSGFATAHRDFHALERAAFTSPFIDGLVADMYRHLQRHHRVRLVRSRTPRDFLSLDRATVEALAAGDGLRARRILEFHLVEAAISFILAADGEHRPSLLLAVTAVNGMQIELNADGGLTPPARVTWDVRHALLPDLRTAYLYYDSAASPE